VNDAVVRDARARGILVNRADADEEDPGDFTVPAKWRGGAVTVAVSAGGSAALAVLVRDGLAGRFDPRWSRMADAMAVLRPALRDAMGLEPAARRLVFRDLATEEALDVLHQRDVTGLLDWLRQRHRGMTKPTDHG
jgi:siroheme synthase (precorrin-2 oxidase/ferrochelatase)